MTRLHAPELSERMTVVGAVILEVSKGVSKPTASDAFERITGEVLRDINLCPGLDSLLPQYTDELYPIVSIETRALQVA